MQSATVNLLHEPLQSRGASGLDDAMQPNQSNLCGYYFRMLCQHSGPSTRRKRDIVAGEQRSMPLIRW